MHRTAEYGIAAHWLFKEGRTRDELDRHLAWFRQLLELQQDAHSPEEFLEFLKIDLYQDEIFVFTPRGDVKRLPKGATSPRGVNTKISSWYRSIFRNSRNSSGECASCCSSSSWRNHARCRSSSSRVLPSLNSQCAAMPYSAVRCMSRVRI